MNAVAVPSPAASTGRLLYVTIFVLVAIEFLQSGMTAFAAGPIMGETGMSPEDFSLVAAVYASGAIVSIAMQRWFVERLGGRGFIQGATAVSAVGAMLCAGSHTFQGFLLGRAVMALGGGALFTSARMIPHHLLAGPKRFTGIKVLATAVASSIAAAPWLASLAVSGDTWSAMFWLIAALDALAFVLAGLTLSPIPLLEPGRASHPRPWPLLVLLAGGSFVLLYGLQRLNYDFYGNVLLVALLMVFAVTVLIGWGWRQAAAPQPLLRVRSLLHLRYGAGIALFLFAYVMLGANNYMVPVLLQRTLGYAWSTVGHVEALGFLGSLGTWLVMSRVLPRAPSPRKFLVLGFLALAGFGALLGRIDTGVNLWQHVLPALMLNAMFLLTVLPVAAMQTFRQTEYDESVFSNAQQLKNMLAQAGIALGITLATLGQQWRTAVHYTVLNSRVVAGDPLLGATVQRVQGALAGSMDAGDALRVATATVARQLAQQAALLANLDHFHLLVVLGLLGALVTLVQRVFR